MSCSPRDHTLQGQRPSTLCPGIPLWKPTAAHLTRAHLSLRHVAAPFLLSVDPSNPNSFPLIFPSQLSCYSPNLLCPFLLSGYGTLSMLNSCQSNLQSRGLSWEHSSVFCCFRLQELSIWNLYFGVCEGLTLEMALSEAPHWHIPALVAVTSRPFRTVLRRWKR